MHITLITWVRFLSCVGLNMHYQTTSFAQTLITKISWKKVSLQYGLFICYKATSYKFSYYTEYMNTVKKVSSPCEFFIGLNHI